MTYINNWSSKTILLILKQLQLLFHHVCETLANISIILPNHSGWAQVDCRSPTGSFWLQAVEWQFRFIIFQFSRG